MGLFNKKKTDKEKEEKKKFKKVLKRFWLATFLILASMILGVFAISQGWLGELPAISDLQNPINKSASRIYSADGKQIGTWSYASENRIMVTYDSLPDNLVKALVATEDVRFYDHSGIDVKALGRAVVKRLIMGQKSAGGGSTLTQQLAKQLYSEVARDEKERMMQKPIEWYIAVELERYYTKEEIITMYLNYFDFLYNAVGIKTAAQTYFGKKTIDLDLNECATLVGMCKNPSLYNPIRYDSDGNRIQNQNCIDRRNVVLGQMVKAGYISQAECDQVSAMPLNISRFHLTDHKEGVAPYFREYLRRTLMAKHPERSDYASWQYQQYHDDSLAWETNPMYGWCNKNTKKDGSNYNIYTDGLKIYTTLDTRMQAMAEEAIFEHVAQYLQPHFEVQNRGLAVSPYRGISADKANKIIDRACRQSERWRVMKADGASDEEIMKAFRVPVEMQIFKYGTSYHNPQIVQVTMTPRDSVIYYKQFLRSAICAMDPQGRVKAYVPGLNFTYFQFDNILGGGHRQVGSTIKPLLYSLAVSAHGFTSCDMVDATGKSYGGWRPKGGVMGMVPMKNALAASSNQASVWLCNLVTPKLFMKYLQDDLGISTVSMQPNLTLALGSGDISLGDMCSAYTIFPSYGVHYAPMLVTRIETADGDVVATFSPRMNEVLSKEQSLEMIICTRAVVNSGTGRRLRGAPFSIHADIAGKTGTTNSNADGWFMGYCPKLVVGAWVGGDDRDIHFATGAFGQGAAAALPIWGKFMRKVYDSHLFDISQDDKFDFPKDYKACEDELKSLPTFERSRESDNAEAEPEVEEEFF